MTEWALKGLSTRTDKTEIQRDVLVGPKWAN